MIRIQHTRKAGLWALVLLASAGSASLAAETVTFTEKKLQPGAVRTESSRMKMNLNLAVSVGGVQLGTFKQTEAEVTRKLEKVLAVKGGVPNEISVTYKKAIKVKTARGQTRTKAKEIQGKSYKVKGGPAGSTVVYLDGKAPGGKEVGLVRKDYKSLGKPDRMEQNLVGRQLTKGQRAPFLESTLREFVAGGKADEVRDLKIIFKGTRSCAGFQCGVFDISLTMGAKIDANAEMSMTLNGEIMVRVEGAWPVSINLKGPVSMQGSNVSDGRKMEMKGGGEMELNIEYVYK